MPIRVQVEPGQRDSLDTLRHLPVAARQGTVPLEAVAKIEMGSGPSKIDRLDRVRNMSVEAELGDRILGDLLEEANRMPSLQQLPAGSAASPMAMSSTWRNYSPASASA